MIVYYLSKIIPTVVIGTVMLLIMTFIYFGFAFAGDELGIKVEMIIVLILGFISRQYIKIGYFVLAIGIVIASAGVGCFFAMAFSDDKFCNIFWLYLNGVFGLLFFSGYISNGLIICLYKLISRK